jgi:uncharacterized protein with HEPN domain
MLEAVEKIFIYSREFETANDFFKANDQLNYNASNNLLLVIGEESKKLETDLKNEFIEIPWPLIAQLRNRLAHDYRGINPEVIHNIIQGYLPDLKKVLIQMIDQLAIDKLVLQEALFSDFYTHLTYLNSDTSTGRKS